MVAEFTLPLEICGWSVTLFRRDSGRNAVPTFARIAL